jgi:hypothetical protein
LRTYFIRIELLSLVAESDRVAILVEKIRNDFDYGLNLVAHIGFQKNCLFVSLGSNKKGL